jgi:hypothetical protein
MKARSIVMSLVTCFVALTLCLAEDAMMGTWKLNEAKSRIGAGSPKNNTIVIEAAGENVKVTTDGVDAAGKPTHNEWTGKFDGKDYPVTGDANSDTRAYKKIDVHTVEVTVKKGGRVVISGRVVVSPDGKTRTADVKGTSPSGEKFHTTAVYDKQ